MKKIILGVITCLLSLSVFGQVNEFKFGFPLRANGGLNVGTDKVQLDSIVRDGTTIKFYTGVTELLPNMAGGSVTSVGMTVPTGLSISGSPITSSGTLGLTFAPGYSIPSNASQSNWNTAYNWGDHVLGGYQSQSDILDDFAALTNSAGVLTNDGSGGLTWTAVGGTGTVTSVALSVPTGLSVSGSPITSSGTLAISLASGYSIPSTSVQSNWTTAYSERAQWDGGSTNLVASTGRTSLGATTVGSNLFTLTNPSAIRFIRINADNTVSVLTATDFKTALTLSASDVSLGNVTNESKTTMFTSPIFTGIAPRLGSPVTDTLATRAYARSVGGGGGGVVGIALNSGTITLTGDGGTADDITFYTNGDGSYDLPAGGGNLTIMPQVQGWIKDSLDARIGDGVELSTIGVMKADSTGGPGHYASWYDMTTGLTSKVNNSDTTSMLSHYILASEVSSTYAPLSSPNFSGTPLLATSDTLATQAYARSYGGSGTVTTDDVEALITANARLNVDTIPLFVFGLGSGVAADTAVFNNNAIAGVFYNSGADTLHITSIRGVLSEGSGTETIGVQVSWHTTFKSGSATNLNASAYTVTSITTGDEDTSFANNEIPPNAWVWCTISGVSAGNKPSLLIVTMTGYKIRNW